MTYKLSFLLDEFHYAVANVAARSAQLDHQIEFTIETLFDDMRNTAEFILKRGMSGDRLADLLEALLKDAFPQETSDIEQHIKNAKVSMRPYREEKHGTMAADVMATANAMLEAAHHFSEWGRKFQEEKLRSLRESSEQQSLLNDLLSTSVKGRRGMVGLGSEPPPAPR